MIYLFDMATCRQPIEVPIGDTKRYMLAPCNKCPECLQRKKQTWIHRIECEKRFGNYKNCYMVGLSYNDNFLPYESFKRINKGEKIDCISTGESLLNPYDLRLFIERLRHFVNDGFSYFAVGEYGDRVNTHRPHFHIILFTNLPWKILLSHCQTAWSIPVAESRSERYYRYKQSKKVGHLIKRDKYSLNNRKSYGYVRLQSVTFKRMCYVAKYISKQFGQDEVVPPFYTCSHGLGKGFLNSHECEIISGQNLHYAYMSNGKPTALHRYFSDKMYTPQQRAIFNLSMCIRNCPPADIIDNMQALKDWYHEQMCIEKAHRRARVLRMNGIQLL